MYIKSILFINKSMEKVIMKIEASEVFVKQIINGMRRNYGYSIEDFSFMKEACIPWGFSRTPYEGEKTILLFMDLEQEGFNEAIENQICSKFNCTRENLIKVILISEDKDSGYIENRLSYFRGINLLQDNFIILNLSRKEIQVSDSNMEVIQNQIVDSINNSENTAASKKDIKSEIKATPVTYALIAINIIMFVISGILSQSFTNIDTNILVDLGAKYNPAIEQGQWFRLIACMFLHGGIIHILANMYSLYSIGPFVERLYGKFKYILVYFVSGISASLFSFWFSPHSVSIGASGAIFGVFGVIFIFAVKERKRVGKGFLMNIASVLGINIFIGLGLPGIDNFAHLGGLLGGITFGIIVSLISKK
jgi:rhomboid protease GluP